MKKILTILAVVMMAICSTALVSCGDDDNNNPNTTVITMQMTCNDGVSATDLASLKANMVAFLTQKLSGASVTEGDGSTVTITTTTSDATMTAINAINKADFYTVLHKTASVTDAVVSFTDNKGQKGYTSFTYVASYTYKVAINDTFLDLYDVTLTRDDGTGTIVTYDWSKATAYDIKDNDYSDTGKLCTDTFSPVSPSYTGALTVTLKSDWKTILANKNMTINDVFFIYYINENGSEKISSNGISALHIDTMTDDEQKNILTEFGRIFYEDITGNNLYVL